MSFYQGGDFTAFEVLYMRHAGRILAYFQKKVPAETAHDLLQDVYAKLHKSRGRYDEQYPFLPWIFTLARNTLFDFFKEAESKLAQNSSSSPRLLENIAADTPNASLDISDMLAALPQAQKRAIELRYLQDWSFEKIAIDLKSSEDNIRQLISRGLKKIRLSIPRNGGDE